jgi:hypothetical protein
MKDEYELNFRDEERNLTYGFNVYSAPHWEVHREFITFLSAIYGYDLHKEYSNE